MKLDDISNLDFNNAGLWPLPVKMIAFLLVAAIVGAAGYWYDTKDMLVEVERKKGTERQLRTDFQAKQRVVANVEVYRERLEKLRGLLAVAVDQLPTRTEMPDLLESISDTGKVNGLAFELFKPEGERPTQEFLAAVPISIRARATYHQFGAFISSVAAMDRIVTLESANLVDPGRTSIAEDDAQETLEIQATLQTYRYLEDSEEAVN